MALKLPGNFKALWHKKIAGIPAPVVIAGAGVVGVLAYRRYAGGGGASGDSGLGGPADGGSASDYSGGFAGGGGEASYGGGGESGGDYTVGPGGAFLPEVAGIPAAAPIIRNVTRIVKRQRIRIGKKVVYRGRKPGREPRVVVQNRVVVNQNAARRKARAAAAKRKQGPYRNEGRPLASGGRRRPNSPPIVHKRGRAASELRPKRRKGQSPPIVRTGK